MEKSLRFHSALHTNKEKNQWQIQKCLRGAPTPEGGALTLSFGIRFVPKTAWKSEEIGLKKGAHHTLISLDPPLEMLDYRVFPSENFRRKTWSLLFKRHV